MKILLKKDGEGFLARVRGSDTLYAFGLTREDALDELTGVIDMTMDYHLELIEIERQAKQEILSNRASYAV